MTNWYDSIVTALKNSIEAVFEKKSNKVTSISSSSTDTQYPSAKCVKDELGDVYSWTNDVLENKQDSIYKTIYLNEYSSDDEYPSAKCVYDELESKADTSDVPTHTSDLTNDGDGTNAFLTQHQSLTDYVQKSQTNGLLKNDGSIDTNSYLTSTSISGKEDSSNKVSSWSSTTTDTHYPSEKLVKDSLDGKASSSHTHTKSQITDFPSTMTPSSHTHGNLQNDGKIKISGTAQASKNVVTDANGNITTENKPTIPTGSSTATDIKMNGTQSAGSSSNFAKADHVHPVDTSRAPSDHNHDGTYLKSYTPPTGSTSQAGIVQLEDSVSSTSTTKAATPNAVKTAYDKANHSHPYASSSHNHDGTYLKTHQDISGKVDKSNGASQITDSNSANYSNINTSRSGSPIYDLGGATQQLLNNRINLQLGYKFDTAGTGLNNSGTTLNHSNSITAQTTAAFKKITYDAQGHITGTDDVTASDLPITQNDKALTRITSLASGWSGIVKYMVKNGWCIVAYEDLKKSSTTSAFDNICQLPYTPASGLVYAGGSADMKVNCNVRVTGGGYLSARCFVANGGQYGSITFPINGG